ncbi:phosphotransferase enzyme family protein [Allostreptomyces psammosilenae]|uniref:Aminoglycoside phosphotransferase (APT) family kinase protein n=1 Tax=Allostreptomyces psammosilenae TaxID=1892865 RepID=A0A852ZQT0_9ACTN|nr:aminoglycoside phosphotransferase family protein [Allostreptomyces psammosilenae]NYI04739.1 aminoglycoside phosphotransferase (APT) family kinase protein [Allostreptomyces psammosilenae]
MTLPPFTGPAAMAAAHAACAAVGLSATGAYLRKPPSDNAVVILPAQRLVARIGADASHRARLATELATARWIAGRGIPVTRPAEHLPQLLRIQGRIVTWWHQLTGRGAGRPAALAALLRRLHGEPPPWPPLPAFDPWARLREHIDGATGLSPADRDFLHRHRAELRAEWSARAAATHPVAVVHGDAHHGNTFVREDGTAVLLDLENVTIGPPQWDTAVAVVYHRIGWYDDAAYASYVRAYGHDPAQDPHIDLHARIRMLRMTAWYASRTDREPWIVEQVRHRVDTLRDGGQPVRWRPG